MAKGKGAKEDKARAASSKAEKQSAQAAEEEEKLWAKGSKPKKSASEDKEQKAAEALAAKRERDRLLQLEEESISVKLAKKVKPASAVRAPVKVPTFESQGDLPSIDNRQAAQAEVLSADSIDASLDILSLVNEKADDAAQGDAAAKLDAHPERRVKAEFAKFEASEMDRYRKENKGLRGNQIKDLMWQDFKKSDLNPMNKVNIVDYNATKEERLQALQNQKAAAEEYYKSVL